MPEAQYLLLAEMEIALAGRSARYKELLEEYGYGSLTGASMSFSISLPPLGTNERRVVYEGVTAFFIPGTSWVILEAGSADSKQVLLTKSKKGEGSSRVEFLILVIPRIELEILLALQQRR